MKTISVISNCGGVGKTTSAIYLAGFLSLHGSTILIDDSEHQEASNWAKREKLSFIVTSQVKALSLPTPEYLVVDTKGNLSDHYVEEILNESDFVILPFRAQETILGDPLGGIKVMKGISKSKYAVLFTICSSYSDKRVDKYREIFSRTNIQMFNTQIRKLPDYFRQVMNGTLDTVWFDEDYQKTGKELLRFLNVEEK